MNRALIIDDESPARAALRGLLRSHPEIAVVGEAATINEARQRLAAPDYDLVFLDVQLLGGTGFELLEFVRPEANVVFVTGFEHYAVRAFEANAVDYLMKPVRPERLADTLQRIAARRPADDLPPHPLPPLLPNDRVHLKTGHGTTRFVPLADIAAIESDENYTNALLRDGTHLQVRRTMKQWEDILPSSHFVRAHRGTIVNLDRYRGAERESYETMLLTLDGLAAPVRASFRYLPELRTRLLALGREL